jgi:hypothetical protein
MDFSHYLYYLQIPQCLNKKKYSTFEKYSDRMIGSGLQMKIVVFRYTAGIVASLSFRYDKCRRPRRDASSVYR